MTADELWRDQVRGPDLCVCGHTWRAHVDRFAVSWADYVGRCGLMCCECQRWAP